MTVQRVVGTVATFRVNPISESAPSDQELIARTRGRALPAQDLPRAHRHRPRCRGARYHHAGPLHPGVHASGAVPGTLEIRTLADADRHHPSARLAANPEGPWNRARCMYAWMK